MSEAEDTSARDSLARDAWIDGLCDCYEASLKLGERITIPEFLRIAGVKEGADPQLLRELARLQAAYASNAATHATAEQDAVPTPTFTLPFAPGQVIANRYKLVEVIGEGGMGTVFRADQSEPVKRPVALKLIRDGRDSRTVLARFDAERQALAVMDHPNIARVFDGGSTSTGQPFFVMELVNGIPITAYCDRERLSVQARLELFVAVCQAVQHAHQKGIIHRDLKPGNILVTEVDGRPTPKVIDFGVAKATEQKLTDESIPESGAIVGTPAYMSPEQADPASMDIDTRTDVYALGVILYELLAGSTPIEAGQFKRGAILEMLRMVRDVDPPKPSTKASTGDALPNIAANRGIEPGQLKRALQGDLDWIVMKALEKDRARRYQTANGFAADIQRHLAYEPVLAAPPSQAYRLRKFVRKNRGTVVAAGLVFASLLGGIAGTGWQAWRAKKALEAESLRAVGERQANEKARTQLEHRKKANDILNSVFLDLDVRWKHDQKEPLEAVLSKRLIQAAKQLEDASLGDPLETAGLKETLGHTLLALGSAKEAIPLLTHARNIRMELLGADHPSTLQSSHSLGAGHHLAGDIGKSLPLWTETYERRREVLGPTDQKTLMSMNCVAGVLLERWELNRALQLFEECHRLTQERFGPDHDHTLACAHNLGSAYFMAAQEERGVRLIEEVLAKRRALRGPDHVETIRVAASLADKLVSVGKSDAALAMLRECVQRFTAVLGSHHPDTLRAMSGLCVLQFENSASAATVELLRNVRDSQKNTLGAEHMDTIRSTGHLAYAYSRVGRFDLALPMGEDAYRSFHAKYGPNHLLTLACIGDLASIHESAGKTETALTKYEEALRSCTLHLGSDHSETLKVMCNYALCLKAAGKRDLALPLQEKDLELRKAKFGDKQLLTRLSMFRLANHHLESGRIVSAQPLYELALDGMKAEANPDPVLMISCMQNLAICHGSTGRQTTALALSKEAHELSMVKLGAEHPKTLGCIGNLVGLYFDLNKAAEAVPLIPKLLEARRKELGAESNRFAEMLGYIAGQLMKADEWTAAEPYLRELLTICGKQQPDVWSTFLGQSCLGYSLMKQMKYAEAEKPLLDGYEGMKNREKSIPAETAWRLPESIDRIVALYVATDNPAEAKKWRAERAKYGPEELPVPRDGK